MQGIYLNGRRPKSKAELKRVLADYYTSDDQNGIYSIVVEATSLFGDEASGSLAQLERDGVTTPIYFVGPNPHTDRRFYGTLTHKDGKWTIK